MNIESFKAGLCLCFFFKINDDQILKVILSKFLNCKALAHLACTANNQRGAIFFILPRQQLFFYVSLHMNVLLYYIYVAKWILFYNNFVENIDRFQRNIIILKSHPLSCSTGTYSQKVALT